MSIRRPKDNTNLLHTLLCQSKGQGSDESVAALKQPSWREQRHSFVHLAFTNDSLFIADCSTLRRIKYEMREVQNLLTQTLKE